MAIFVDNVYEMNGSVIELSRSHAILWVFWDKENNKLYSQVIKDHSDFFDAIADSLFLGFCVISYRLFQDAENVLSLPCLINYLSSVDQKLKERLTLKIDALRWTPKTGPQVKMDFRWSAGEEKADDESKTQTA